MFLDPQGKKLKLKLISNKFVSAKFGYGKLETVKTP